MVHWPGHAKKGMVSEALISQMDLLASFATLTHQKQKKDVGPDSFDMLPTLLGKNKKGRNQLVEQTNSPSPLGLIKGKWKYIEPHKGRKVNRNTNTELSNNAKPQLYNLEDAIGEQHNVADQYPERVNNMEKFLDKIKKEK